MTLELVGIIILSGVLLITLGVLYLVVFKHFSIKDPSLRIGIFSVLLVLLVFVYYHGLMINEGSVDYISLLSAITKAIQVFVISFDVDSIALALENTLFRIAYYIIVILSCVYAIANIIILVFAYLSNVFKLRITSKQKCIYLLGEENKIKVFLKSIENDNDFDKKTGYKIIIIIPREKKHSDFLCKEIKQHAVRYLDIEPGVVYEILDLESKKEQKLISLYDNDKFNSCLVTDLYKIILDYELNINAYINLNNLDELDIWTGNRKVAGIITLFNYSKITSLNFVFNHPLEFNDVNKKHYFLVGFGDTNNEIMKHLFVTNVSHKINCKYTIIANDIEDALNDFLHSLHAITSLKQEQYLELPHIADFKSLSSVKNIDINNVRFYEELSSEISPDEDLIFIVGVGDDIKNIKAAQVIKKYINDSGILNNTNIFIRVKDSDLSISDFISSENVNVSKFGCLDDVYDYRNILSKDYSILAQLVHHFISNNDTKDAEIDLEQIKRDWENNDTYFKNSSLSAVLSLRNKLRSIGFDLAKGEKSIEEQVYYKRYDPENNRNLWKEIENIESMERYLENNKRNLLAQDEHERWNRYMILEGFRPLSLKDFNNNISKRINKPGRDISRRKNICITTYKGLKEYAILLDKANKSNKTNYYIDYIIYDYKMMDNLPKIVRQSVFKIVEYNNESE